jgi:hypothetical protein
LTVAELLATLAFFSLMEGNPPNLRFGLTLAAYFSIGIAWFMSFTFVRCPACDRSPAAYHMVHGPAGTFFDRFAATVTCPDCGFDPSKGDSDGEGKQPAA